LHLKSDGLAVLPPLRKLRRCQVWVIKVQAALIPEGGQRNLPGSLVPKLNPRPCAQTLSNPCAPPSFQAFLYPEP
jgi:hypothetical protein